MRNEPGLQLSGGRRTAAIVVAVALLFAGAGCRPTAKAPERDRVLPSPTPVARASYPPRPAIDVCSLVSQAEMTELAGTAISGVVPSSRDEGDFRTGQCFYQASDAAKSVVITVTQAPENRHVPESPRDFWRSRFGIHAERDNAHDPDGRGEAEGEHAMPPQKIEGLGDDAYWIAKGGALYVLKGDVFLRLSIGGAADEQAKLRTLQSIAQRTVERL